MKPRRRRARSSGEKIVWLSTIPCTKQDRRGGRVDREVHQAALVRAEADQVVSALGAGAGL